MTARIAHADYGFDRPVTRLVVIDGSLCSTDCPHHRPTIGCNAFWAQDMLPTDNGRAWRGSECAQTASITSEPRAKRAYELLLALRGRKAETVTKTAKKTDELPKKKPADTRIQKDTRHLKIALSREEIEERADRASYLWAELGKQEAEAKSIASTFKAKISEIEGKIDALQQQVRDRCAYGDVDCDIVFDFKEKSVYTIRLDTKEEVDRRDMRRDEMQEVFEFKADDDALTKAIEKVQAELDEQGDRTASELKARAKKQKQAKS